MLKRPMVFILCFTLLGVLGLALPGCGGGDPQQQGSFEVDSSEPGRQQLRPMRPQEAPAEDAPEPVEAPSDEMPSDE